MAKISHVSPLAPKNGFPQLPAIKGAMFSTAEAGVKYKNRTDVMLCTLCEGTTIAGTFTKSATRSAPVLDCQAKIGLDGAGRAAFLVNSGNSNAFTGKFGVQSVQAVTAAAAETLGIEPDRIFTASTGVIGEPMKHDRIIAKLETLRDTQAEDAMEAAAHAIMTTDTYPKGASKTCEIGGQTVTISGFAKGSGMIAPDMATMLVYLFTDAKISRELLQRYTSDMCDASFNKITVDSDTSTSDTLLMAATGASGVDIDSADTKGKAAFVEALHDVMLDLAHQVVKDGEGATKFVTINVTNAADKDDAFKIAMAIANSPLVKTAIAGEDPNWGRVVMAVGKSGAQADRDKLSIRFGDILVAENGWVSPDYREEDGANYMKNEDISISVDMGIGTMSATVWTCDLTHQYISINADYRS